MERTSTHTYAASAETVFAVLTDPQAVQAKYVALGHRDVHLLGREAKPDGGVMLRTRRTVPMEVPGFAKKVLSPTNQVVQEDVWGPADATGARKGRWTVDAKGVPVKVAGTIVITPVDAHRCTVEVRAEISCGIPLVGGKIAGFVGDDVLRTVHAEEVFTDDRLASA
jgi:hypothetical protein